MNLEEILEAVKADYEGAYIKDNELFYIVLGGGDDYCKLIIEEGYIYIEFYNCENEEWEVQNEDYSINNIIELKNYLEIEPTWEDISKHFEEMVEKNKDLKKYLIRIEKDKIQILNNDISNFIYYCNGDISFWNFQIWLSKEKNDNILSSSVKLESEIYLYQNLTLYKMYQQITLKVENIIDNLK